MRDRWRQKAKGGKEKTKKKIGQAFKDAEMLGRKNDAYLIMLAALKLGEL